MAFKSTLNRSHLRVVREVEAIGGSVQAAASREQMTYTYDALKTYAPQMVELLVDAVRNPAFLDWEVKEQVSFESETDWTLYLKAIIIDFLLSCFVSSVQLEKMKVEIADFSKNPQALLLEAIHSAGYAGPFANPLLASEASLSKLDGTALEEFVAVSVYNLYQ